MRLKNTEAAEILILHSCLNEAIRMNKVGQLMRLLHPHVAVSSLPTGGSVLGGSLRMQLRMRVGIANLA